MEVPPSRWEVTALIVRQHLPEKPHVSDTIIHSFLLPGSYWKKTENDQHFRVTPRFAAAALAIQGAVETVLKLPNHPLYYSEQKRNLFIREASFLLHDRNDSLLEQIAFHLANKHPEIHSLSATDRVERTRQFAHKIRSSVQAALSLVLKRSESNPTETITSKAA